MADTTAFYVEIDAEQIKRVAQEVGRTKEQTYAAAMRHSRNMADKIMHVIQDYTPIYDDASLKYTTPGQLREAWTVARADRGSDTVVHEVFPVGDSHAGTGYDTPWIDIVYWLDITGVSAHNILAKNTRIWWENIADYFGSNNSVMGVTHQGFNAIGFVTMAVEAGETTNTLDDTGRVYIFDLEMGLGMR